MKSITRRITAAAVAGLSLIVFGVAGVAAQTNGNRTANGFRISPVRSEFTIDKGKSESLTITIENPTDVATTAKATVNDFVASEDESGEPRLILDDKAPAPKNSFKQLVSGIDNVELGPKQKKDITVAVKVPEGANAGGYYGAIRFAPASASQGANVGLTASVGTIILVTVPGNLTQRLDLAQLSAAQNGKAKSFFTSGNVDVLTRLKNSGDIHVKPFGKVQIKNMFGKVVNEFEFNNAEPRANILPDSTRKFTNSLPKAKLLGRYTIEANLGYSQGSGNLITAKASFWYMPVWAMILLMVIILAIVGGIYYLVRKFSSKPKSSAKTK